MSAKEKTVNIRKGSKFKAGVRNIGVVTSNKLQVLEDEVRDEPCLMLVKDSLMSYKRGCPRKKHFYYTGK